MYSTEFKLEDNANKLDVNNDKKTQLSWGHVILACIKKYNILLRIIFFTYL